MAQVIWKGEDHLHDDDRGGPTYTIWNGVKFPKGKPVEVNHPVALEKARGNPFFDVIEDVEKGVKTAVKTAAKAAAEKIDGDKN